MFGQISRVLIYFYLIFYKLQNVDINGFRKKRKKVSKLQKNVLVYRGGVLEDVLGLEDVLEDTF